MTARNCPEIPSLDSLTVCVFVREIERKREFRVGVASNQSCGRRRLEGRTRVKEETERLLGQTERARGIK